MMIVDEATRVVRGVADATTTVAGAVGGGVIGGVTGGIRGSAEGVRDGIRAGSSSTPTAVLTMAAVGAAGLVEWPVLLQSAARPWYSTNGIARAVGRIARSRRLAARASRNR